MIKQVEEELAEVRMYKGKVAIYQGDNWHDNPELYQTELKEKYLMTKLHNLRQEFFQYEIIKERTNEMISEIEILNPNLIEEGISSEKKEKIINIHNKIIKGDLNTNQYITSADKDMLKKLMLYKMAYTSIVLDKKYAPEKYLVIVSDEENKNNIIKDLSFYMPESIPVVTAAELFIDYTNEKISIINDDIFIKEVKEKIINKESLDAFLNNYLNNGIVNEDIKILDEVLFTKKEVKDALFSSSNNNPNYNWACLYLSNKCKSNYDFLCNQITSKYYDMIKKMPFDSEERKEYITKINEIRTTFKDKGIKIIKDYFKRINKKKIDIYSLYISSLELDSSDKMSLKMKGDILKNLKKHKLSYIDLFASLYIYYYLEKKTQDYIFLYLYDLPINSDNQINLIDNIFNKTGLAIFSSEVFDNSVDKKYETINLNDIDDRSKILLKNKKNS